MLCARLARSGKMRWISPVSATESRDRAVRIERGVGILEHHPQLQPDRLEAGAAHPQQVLALEQGRAAVGPCQPHDAAPDRRLAAARLADDPQHLAAADLQRDLADRADVVGLAAAPGGERLGEVTQFQYGVIGDGIGDGIGICGRRGASGIDIRRPLRQGGNGTAPDDPRARRSAPDRHGRGRRPAGSAARTDSRAEPGAVSAPAPGW